jgi:hypothetical protein
MASPAERVAEALVPERAEHEVRDLSRERERTNRERERDLTAFDWQAGKKRRKNSTSLPLSPSKLTPRASRPRSCKSMSTPWPAAERRRPPEPTARWPLPLEWREKEEEEEETTTLVVALL